MKPGTTRRANSPAARAVRLLLATAARGRATAPELARELGATVRAVRQDLKLLEDIAPVRHTGEREQRRWEMDPGWQVAALGVLDRIALELGREVSRFLRGTALGVGSFAPLDGIDGRYSRNLSRKLRVLHEPGRDYAPHTETLDTVMDCLLRERQLSFDYRSPGRAASRRYEAFTPLTLVLYRRAVYLVGRTAEGEVRRLALDRIGDAEGGAHFDYPSDWRPDAELRPWFGIFAPRGGRAEPVVLRFSAKAAPFVRARSWHHTQQLADLPDGGVELRLHTGGQELVRFCLEWGQTCEVVEPEWLRAEVLDELEGAMSNYREPPQDEPERFTSEAPF